MPDNGERHMIDKQPLKAEPKPLFHVGQEGVTTRDGRKVRILCVDMKGGDENIVALVEDDDGSEFTRTYFANGRYVLSEEDARDLIPPPPPKQYAWMYIYKDPEGNLLGGNPHRIKVPHGHVAASSGGAVGYIRVELAERWDD